jgi:hypothetical protein
VHPATILSIILLLLNDHLFKAIAPSWITGKVSDFAGLFFFPFLLAAVLSVFLAPLRHITPMIIGRMAFSITAAWFTIAKATPLGHALTVQVVSTIVGHEVSVILDPTDLLALVMLWPAWRQWRREAVKADFKLSIRAGWLALALATIATVATSPPPPPEEVVRVVVADGKMYARTCCGVQWYETSDNGKSWSRVDPIPEGAKEVWSPPEEVVVTDPHNPLILYRVKRERYRREREGRVEYSEDGGSTWQIAWQVPAGRRQFVDRSVREGLFAWPTIEMGPNDLAFTPDSSGTLVVAMGTEGVLVRDPSGTWARYPVGSTSPTPFSTLNPAKVIDILDYPEGVVLDFSVLLVSVVVSILGWVPILRAVKRVHGGRKVVWAIRPILVSLVVLLLVMAGGYVGYVLVRPGPSTSILGFLGGILFSLVLLLFVLPIVPMLLAVLVPVALSLIIWSRVISLASDKESAERSRNGSVWTTVGLFLAGWLPFFLWGAGLVPWYNVALVSAIVLGLAVVVVGATRVYRHSRAAVGQDQPHVPASNAP